MNTIYKLWRQNVFKNVIVLIILYYLSLFWVNFSKNTKILTVVYGSIIYYQDKINLSVGLVNGVFLAKTAPVQFIIQ